MKKTDIELITNLQGVFDRYLEDQRNAKPLHKIEHIPSGVQGSLADLLFIDKIDNDALVNFISILLGVQKGRSNEEILTVLQDISKVLHSYNFDADDTGKAN